MSGDLRVLTAIDFVGNDSLGADELKGQIVTSETTGTFSKDVRYYDPAVFAVDQKRIIRWYNGRGFYRAGVEKVEEIQDAEGRVKLAVHVREGPRSIVRRVDFDGAGDLSAKEIQRLRDAIALPAGEPFDEDRYEKSKLQLVAELREGGFARAEAGGRVRVDTETGDTAITYTLRTGDRFRLGEVTIEGNEAVPTAKIARAAAIEAGAPFKPSALQLAQKRIYRLGVFSGVRILAEPVDADGEAPVTVRVREAPFHTVRYGGGLALDAYRWQVPIVRAEYTDRFREAVFVTHAAEQVGQAWLGCFSSWNSKSSSLMPLPSSTTSGWVPTSSASFFQSATPPSAPRTWMCAAAPRMRARISFSKPFITDITVISAQMPSAIPAIEMNEMKEMKCVRRLARV